MALDFFLDVEFLDLPGERIPLKDGTVDTVLSTFTLCTIPGVVEALRGVRRVLKPGGKLIFFEHGLSPDPRVRRWQKWSAPIPHWLFEGCHVTRDIPSLIEHSGFRIDERLLDDAQMGFNDDDLKPGKELLATLTAEPAPGEQLYVSHFATCPNAPAHRL